MKIKINGEIYECEKAVKGKDFVKLYDVDGNAIAEFRGIKDFAGYEVINGAWSEAPKTTEQILAEQLLSVQVELAKIKMGVK
jgi:hypothetical protein